MPPEVEPSLSNSKGRGERRKSQDRKWAVSRLPPDTLAPSNRTRCFPTYHGKCCGHMGKDARHCLRPCSSWPIPSPYLALLSLNTTSTSDSTTTHNYRPRTTTPPTMQFSSIFSIIAIAALTGEAIAQDHGRLFKCGRTTVMDPGVCKPGKDQACYRETGEVICACPGAKVCLLRLTMVLH